MYLPHSGIRFHCFPLIFIPKYLSDEIERVQKRILRIVYPNLHYEDALIEARMESLYARREIACNKLFNQILNNPNHKLII